MEFEATGTFHGEPVRLKWRDGRIVESDRPQVADEIALLVEAGITVGLPGLVSGTASLRDPMLARATIAAVIEDVEFSEEPEIDPLPPGAVAGSPGAITSGPLIQRLRSA
jgi:hypothetical protein